MGQLNWISPLYSTIKLLGSNVLYVDPLGDDINPNPYYKTITMAINSAKYGQLVYVLPMFSSGKLC